MIRFIKLIFAGFLIFMASHHAYADAKFKVDAFDLKDFFEEHDLYYKNKGFTLDCNQEYPIAGEEEPLKDSVIVTENCLETLSWELELMKCAQHSIELSGSFCGGQVFRNILAVMRDRLEKVPHLQVHILTSPTLLEKADEIIVESLKRRFPDRFHFMITANVLVLLPDLTSIDNHVKVVIVDEKYFTTGGTNKDDTLATDGTYPAGGNNKGGIVGDYLPSGVRDMDIVGCGPIAKTMRLQYFKLYSLWDHFNTKGSLEKNKGESIGFNHYFPVPPQDVAVVEAFDTSPRRILNPKIEMVFSGPMDHPNKISKKYESLMDQARSSVVIANLYWNPVDFVLHAAMRAANRNLSLTLYTNGINDTTPKYNDLFAWASRINYVPIIYGREYRIWDYFSAKNDPVHHTRIFEYHVKDILYHKKLMVIDNEIVFIGSYNLGTKSDKSDYEMNIVIESKEVAKEVLKVLQKDQQLSLEIPSTDARDWYFNPFTVYLAGTQKSFHGFMNAPVNEQADDFANDLAKKIKEWNNRNLLLSR